MMNRLFPVFISLMLSGTVSAQTYFKFVVSFRDKAPDSNPYSIDNPSQFLSERSINRRSKMDIKITEQDLPVYSGYISGVMTAGQQKGKLLNKSKWLNHVMVGTTDSTIISTIGQLPYVKNVELVYKGAMPKIASVTQKTEKPSATGNKKSLNGSVDDLAYGDSKVQVEMLGVDYLHRKGNMGQGIMIAVLDAGFTNVNQIPAFDYLRANNQLLGTYDFVLNDTNVYGYSSHGTGVLSCMAAYIDQQYLGTAPKASYYLLRSEDAATETVAEEYNWLAAAEFADSVGVDMINSSLGYTTFDDPSQNHTYADLDGNTTVITRAADWAASRGILVVNSAGNSGNGGWHYIGAPADGDSVLSIGAVNKNRVKAGFSSFGPSADGRIKPDVSAMGELVNVVNTGGAVGLSSGTSFSGPILCGAVASLWSKYPSLDNMTIFEIVKKCSHQFSAPDNSLGYGIPNFGVADLLLQNTSFDGYFENQSIRVYPNPVGEDSFYLDYYSNFTETIKIQISNTKGKIITEFEKPVFEKSMYTIAIRLDNPLASGVYVISVTSSHKRFTTKFVKS